MSATSVLPPFPIFTDSTGSPLESGYIYVGTVNLNPETNPIAVYWDIGLTIPAAQPIRTSGGYPARNGTPAALYVAVGECSILIRDKNGALVFSGQNYQEIIGSEYISFVQSGTGAVSRTMQDKARELVSPQDFGAVGNGVDDDSPAIALASASIEGPIVFTPGKKYNQGGAVYFDKSLGLYDYEPATKTTSHTTFSVLRDVRGSETGVQRVSIKTETSISASCGHQEVGVFSILNVLGNAQHHVGIYSQVNLSGSTTTFGYGFCAEVGNVQIGGGGTTSDQALIGYESDIKSKYAYSGIDTPTQRKTGYSAVAWGGGSCTEAYSVYSCAEKNGDGTYNSGDWIFGLKIRNNSLHNTLGTGIAIDSDHSSGLVMGGKSAVYGISLAGSASAGNVGINIGNGYSVAIALQPDRAIKFDGSGGTHQIYYDVGLSCLSIHTSALSISAVTTFVSATAGLADALPAKPAGYLKTYINGVLSKIPFYPN